MSSYATMPLSGKFCLGTTTISRGRGICPPNEENGKFISHPAPGRKANVQSNDHEATGHITPPPPPHSDYQQTLRRSDTPAFVSTRPLNELFSLLAKAPKAFATSISLLSSYYVRRFDMSYVRWRKIQERQVVLCS